MLHGNGTPKSVLGLGLVSASGQVQWHCAPVGKIVRQWPALPATLPVARLAACRGQAVTGSPFPGFFVAAAGNGQPVDRPPAPGMFMALQVYM